jgi:hypothetical protein
MLWMKNEQWWVKFIHDDVDYDVDDGDDAQDLICDTCSFKSVLSEKKRITFHTQRLKKRTISSKWSSLKTRSENKIV